MKLWKAMLLVEATALGAAATLPGGPARAADFRGDGQQQQQQRPHYVEIPLTGPRAEAKAAARPTNSAELDQLIQQLGDPDFRRREDATTKLKQLDPTAARDALRRARDTTADPEVAGRADSVIRSFDQPAQPGQSNRMEWFGIGADNVRGRVIDEKGIRRTELRETARTINILETPDSISISVNGFEQGKPINEQYKARNPEALKREHPEAFELYQKYTSRNATAIRWRPNVPGMPGVGRGAWRFRQQQQAQRMPQVMPMPINPGGFPGAADLVRRQMERANANGNGNGLDPQQRELLERMQRAQRMQALPAGGLGGLGIGGPADEVMDLLQQQINREQAAVRKQAERAMRDVDAVREDARARTDAAMREIEIQQAALKKQAAAAKAAADQAAADHAREAEAAKGGQ
jgi:hypothetical protein